MVWIVEIWRSLGLKGSVELHVSARHVATADDGPYFVCDFLAQSSAQSSVGGS